MAASETVGLLISRRLLKETLAGAPTFEDVKFYLQAARRYGVELLIFEPGGIRARSGKVAGYVERAGGGLRRAVRKIPAVVYDRTSPKRRAAPLWLERRGVQVFNPPVRFDKHDAHALLSRSWTARAYLPETYLLSEATLEWFSEVLAEGGEVFIKPRAGSLGRGVCRFIPLAKGRCRFQAGARALTFASARAAWRRLLEAKGRKADRFILQRGIPLAELHGRRFDLRVPVQRDAEGEWVAAEPRARVAGPGEYVTNVARGGRVVKDVRPLFAESLPQHDPEAVLRAVEEAARAVAAAIARKYPLMADLGLDVGVDRDGRPWLVEVNVRPLRYTVKGVGDWAEPYFPPIGFASYLLRHGPGEGLLDWLFGRSPRSWGRVQSLFRLRTPWFTA